MRITIIGAGVVGCSIALALRRLGMDVTVVDKLGAVGHGSTSASCAIVRRYYSEPGMIALANEGAHVWADWENFLGPIDDDKIVFPRPGMLFIPPEIDAEVRAIVAEMHRLNIKVSILDVEEVRERFSYLDTSSNFPPLPPDHEAFFESRGREIEGAVFEEDAGYVVSPGLATQNLRDAGERDGVHFQLNREVQRIDKRDDGKFELRTEDGASIESEVLVNAAGPHSSIINRLAGVKLALTTRPLRQEVHTLRNPLSNGSTASPLLIVGDMDSGVYWRPEGGGRDIIVGSTEPDCDALDWVDDPDDYDDEISEPYWRRQSMRLMQRFPEVKLGPARGLSALYDVTVEDWYPIVDRTDLPGYYLCIGTSGSSFKTSPVLGQLLAEVIGACESGRDVDQNPIQMKLRYTGYTVDTSFLSRNRGVIQSSGTVIG
ncbi:MAG: FAD-dependent oxidoreductase [Pseudomonadales bacterium]|jgi:sarcosine oxidase subunit beta|nr:FAD-dependent oxidoreductase [Pseudomonadales bacterium]MDP7360230.1 FAD-dependent oxidoreductase [Pseudomonadales bacterium]MDP7596726.1 FAD-dependent oxidoreductase [Pseudomonadales bacterium]HJN50278.1 FAD-dependent oxidoreductase [Pseudomonadales bacterium]|tara:strand:+ start:1487 stop:2779 length:1293 start_codon:yes stop_codon:yes gene_type:complete